MTIMSPEQANGRGANDAASSQSSTAPRVSVCVPVYDKARYLRRTLESVLAQTFTDFELVVLDNASTDGSADVAAALDDPRIVRAANPETLPAPQNFDRVVALSRAPLVKVVSADDLIHPEALARQVAVLDAHPGVAVVSSRHDLVDEHDRVVARDRVLRSRDLVGRRDATTVIRRVVRHGGNPLGVPGNMLFRRAAFDACGGYPDDAFTLDVGLAVRLVEHGDWYGIPETLSGFRLAVGSATSSQRRRNLHRQRAFIRELRRAHPDRIRAVDVAAGTLRAPLTWARHHVLMSASSEPGSLVHRVSAAVLGRSFAPRGAPRAQASEANTTRLSR